jgi:uracil-DNA glycosylase
MFSLEKSWKKVVGKEFKKEYFRKLESFLQIELEKKKIIYPSFTDVFRAFDLTPFNHVKVVILGQDPYHGEGEAHGLAFSVKPGVAIPPSLRNIYTELERDLRIPFPTHGHLIKWASQGVLLLNTVLTVEKDHAASHRNRGWETFTDKIIDVINEEKENVVFVLWGGAAQKKVSRINIEKHLVLESAHPSPLSAYRGFLGCGHFSRINDYLKKHKLGIIDWAA